MKTTVSVPPILLVEDNPMDLDLTLRAFSKKKLSCTFQIARDGEEALAFFPRWEGGESLPAVILLDINMPKVNGLEVEKQIKEHPVFRHIPVVVLTSSREDRDLKTAYDLGVNSYIEKPVSFSQFIEVAEHIERYWCAFNQRPY